MSGGWGWPDTPEALAARQADLALAADSALDTDPWVLPTEGMPPPLLGGCFVAFAWGEAGPGHAGDRAWAAAITWRAPPAGTLRLPTRHRDRMLAGTGPGGPRHARDVEEQAVVTGTAGSAYLPGLLALREGPLLAAAVASLGRAPDLMLVDATGRDHPRRAGLALHLGAAAGIPTVGVTQRPLRAEGAQPGPERGATSPVTLAGEEVGRWVRTRRGARPVLAHAGWRTDPATAAAVVLAASSGMAKTPVPLGEARRVAREARAIAEGRAPNRWGGPKRMER